MGDPQWAVQFISRIKHTHVNAQDQETPSHPLNPFPTWTTVLISNTTDYLHLLLNFKLLES